MDDDFFSQLPNLIIFVIGILFWAFWNFYAKDQHLKAGKKDQERDEEHHYPPKEILEGKTVLPSPSKTVMRKSHVPRTVRDNFNYKSPLTNFSRQSVIDERSYQSTVEKRTIGPRVEADVTSSDLATEDYAKAYDIVQQEQQSRAGKLLASMPNKKQMILVHEIFSSPKALR